MADRKANKKYLHGESGDTHTQVPRFEAFNTQLNEILLRDLLDALPDRICIKDRELRTILCNETYARALGKHPADLYGKTDIENGLPLDLVGGSPETALPGYEQSDRVALEGKQVQVLGERGILGSDARVFDTMKFPLRGEAGEIIGVIGINRDVTGRVQAEEELNRSELRHLGVVNTDLVGIFQITSKGRILFANNTCLQLMECESLSELAARNAASYCRNPDLPQQILDLLRRHGVVTANETTLTTKSGSDRAVILSATWDGSLVSGVLLDITKERSDRASLQSAQDRLRHLSHRLLEAQENERKAIARELHDEIGQLLTATKVNLQIIQRDSLVEDTSARVDRSVTMIDSCLRQIRDLSLGLRPSMLDDLGLLSTLGWQSENLSTRFGFTVQLCVQDLPGRLDPDLEVVCYRVTQEAITNTARHAFAKNVVVDLLLHGKELLLCISDDGIGCDIEAAAENAANGRSFGLLGIQERAALVGGTADFSSAPTEGMRVVLRLPVRFVEDPSPQV